MRYRKGSIALSETRDHPLLRQVLDSGFITHGQLFELLRLDYCVSSRNAFNNRVLRLVKHGLLVRHDQSLKTHELIYSVSQASTLHLAARGEYCVPFTDKPKSPHLQATVHHSLELNDIHLALKRTENLVHWMPEPAIRSRSDFGSNGYWKYYDAIVVVRLHGEDCKFALEYERSPKAVRHYASIRERIEQESKIDHFLYLAPSRDLLNFVAGNLRDCSRAVYFGLFCDFLEDGLAFAVTQNKSPVSLAFTTALTRGRTPQRTRPLFPDIGV